jgi:hypothetical protein
MRKFLYYNNNRHPIQSLEQITHRSVTLSTESATILDLLLHPVHYISIHHHERPRPQQTTREP